MTQTPEQKAEEYAIEECKNIEEDKNLCIALSRKDFLRGYHSRDEEVAKLLAVVNAASEYRAAVMCHEGEVKEGRLFHLMADALDALEGSA